LDDWHLDDSLCIWLSSNLVGLVVLNWNNGNVLLLASLLDELLGFLEELELGQFLLKELKSADLVDASEDEEENDRAHLVHYWPVLGGILLLILVGLNSWAVMTWSSLLSSLGMLIETWSIDSIHLFLEVELAFVVVLLIIFVFISRFVIVLVL